MDEMSCPQCQNVMVEREFAHVTVHRCSQCNGIFLARAELGGLIEGENDWHAHQSANTAAMPRITGDTPAPVAAERTRAYVEVLFKG